jgi:hypothetical protein
MRTLYFYFLRSLILPVFLLTGINSVHAEPGFGDQVDVFCAGMPGFENVTVYGAANCAKCHNPANKDLDQTEAFQLYKNNNKNPSQALCNLEAPPLPPPPAPTCTDNDLDSYSVEGGMCGLIDCNDNDAAINPGATELCSDGIDNNCNMLVDTLDATALDCPVACTDTDNDMFSPDGGACGMLDCNDNNAAINPGAIEICDDNIDNNCNDMIDTAEPSCPVINPPPVDPPVDPMDPPVDNAEMIKAKLKALTAQIKALKSEREALKKQLRGLKKNKKNKKEDDDDKEDEEDDEDDED